VLHQDWLGFGWQKRFAVEQASHDWVLCLDVDERVSDRYARASWRRCGCRVSKSIGCRAAIASWAVAQAWRGLPDWSLRLFDRRVANWSEDEVHEKVLTLHGGSLQGDLLHESQESLAAYLEKQNRYTSLQAEELSQRGKQASFGRLAASRCSGS